MTQSHDSIPIACTLAPGDFQERLTWIADLDRDALLHQQRHDRALTLTYSPAAADRVHELVRREATCCAFLKFDLEEGADAIRLTITAPDGVDADVLLDPFVAPPTRTS